MNPRGEGSTHLTVDLRVGHYGGEVDAALTSLLRLVWSVGLRTISCCQNAGESLADLPQRHPHMAHYVVALKDMAYIDFCDQGSVAAFLNLVEAGGPSVSMHERMSHWLSPGAWQKKLIVLQLLGPEFGSFGEQLVFPTSDIAEIVECLEDVVPFM